MRDILSTEELEIPEGVEIAIKSRIITVKGPRGTLTKNVRHVDMDIRLLKGKANKVGLAVWQGGRKHVACLRTIKSLIDNMITGVTKARLDDLFCTYSALTFLCMIGILLQDARRLCPFPHQLHHSRQRCCCGDPQFLG
jgi:large subunit ribosomal protein L9e